MIGTLTPPGSSPDAPPIEPVLATVGLSAGYGALAVVKSLSIVINPGEVVALLGANGAGKTTTILTLAGVLEPLAGQVLRNGRATRSPLHRRARGGLGLITEERTVTMGLTVAQNLRLGQGSTEAALKIFPELREHLDRKVGLLSGGQQQILAVARALAAEPSVLLADELSLGLAPMIVERLMEAIRRSADDRGVGVLLVEQHIRLALDAADRAYVLQRGSVVLEGPTSDLRNRIDEIEQSYLAGGPADT